MFETVEIKDVKRELGRLVRVTRKQRRVSQIQLAKSLDISRTTIQNLESGKNYTVDTLLKVFKALDLLDKIQTEILQMKDEVVQTKSLY